MGKDRLIRCIINIGKRQRKAGEILIHQKDIDDLKGNRKKAFEILSTAFTQRIIDIGEILTKMEIVLKAKEIFVSEGEEIETKFEHIDIEGKYLGIEKQTALGKSINKEFLGQKEKNGLQ